MKGKLEKTYNKTMRGAIRVVNPIKKRVKKTECIVHQFINIEAIKLLDHSHMSEEFTFYKNYIYDLNRGVKWADADLKSTNHFYHHELGRGLYGFSNAKEECLKYYNEALKLYKENEINKAMFFLGAACHLVQDSTVPAHAMKNLKKHKPLEKYIVNKVSSGYSINVEGDIIKYPDIHDYIINNTKEAVKGYKEFEDIEMNKDRCENISNIIVEKAIRTTAGVLSDFFKEVNSQI